jgi:lysophospholipase L1-like esterase
MFKPYKTLLFLLTVGALCALLAAVFPAQGIQLGEFHFRFAKFEKLFSLSDSTKVKAIAVEKLLTIYNAEDSLRANKNFDKTIQQSDATSALLANLNIQYNKGEKHPLHSFFSGIDGLKTKGTSLRILHYGDSQIEGDRITSILRNTLQTKFGGSGPGMLPAIEVVPSIAIQQSASENWKRYALFGGATNNLQHSNFGALATISRFEINEENKTVWLKFIPSKAGFASIRKYNKAVLHIGNLEAECIIDFAVKGDIVSSETIEAGTAYKRITKHFATTPDELTIQFTGNVSPDVYGISLENNDGVTVDNIAMRGGSGTVFRKMEKAHLNAAFDNQNIGLIILQYGGNTVPYITDSAHAEQYGKFFASQIRYLKSVQPLASFLVIGPADMSTGIDGEMQTFPNLECVRDALKKAALNNGCAFWDLYEVMGGKNSMLNWVAAEPPLAAVDYVHFSPAGAKTVGELFTKHLLTEFNDWKKNTATP